MIEDEIFKKKYSFHKEEKGRSHKGNLNFEPFTPEKKNTTK